MTPDSVPPKPDDNLQFDTVSSAGASAGGAVTCSSCKRSITDQYYHIGGRPICASCRAKAEGEIATWRARGQGSGAMMRAVVYGGAAMVAGALIYWGVMAYLNLEIGIVAILIGWMVGKMIRKATHNLGGRRYQILAVCLTYFAVALAYSPFAFKQIEKKRNDAKSHQIANKATVTDSSATPDDSADAAADSAAPAAGAKGAPRPKMGAGAFLIGLGALLVFILALPVLGIIGSMPSGLISALIIFIGLRAAWQLTQEAKVDIRGPFRVGGPAPQPAK